MESVDLSVDTFPLYVAGLDEAGRGTLAGPVTAACVILKPGRIPSGLADSKQLTPARRDELYEKILTNCLASAVVSVGPRRIEKINIREAALQAMALAANRTLLRLPRGFNPKFVHLLVDGNAGLATTLSHEPIIKGDQLIQSISAASILAKVHRDKLMARLDEYYPGYGFKQHKGYGTREHLTALRNQGPSPAHRRTFAGVREYISEQLTFF